MPKPFPPGTPYYKRFLAGEKGHVHAVQEFGVWVAIIGPSAFVPLLGIVLLVFGIIFGNPFADKFWFEREQAQARAMGRSDAFADWIPDAIDDYKFPKKMRKYWPILSAIYLVWAVWSYGLLGSVTQAVLSYFPRFV